LDIGTGTGLLALLAARRLRDVGINAHVTACELFPPMATLARRVVAHNGMEGCISVVGKRSDELNVGSGVPTVGFEPADYTSDAGSLQAYTHGTLWGLPTTTH
jgi:predicted O-methyltransferase YrrM